MSSKFSSIITAHKGEVAEEANQVDETPAAPTAKPAQKAKTQRKQAQSPAPQETPPVDNPRLGRPATGKRSNPNFEQVTAYIRRETYQAIKIALIQEGNKRDFSDLTEELLLKWLKSQNK